MGLDIQAVADFIGACPHLDADAPISTDYSGGAPVNYGLHDNGKTVIETSIAGTRTFRHAYTLIAVYDTSLETGRRANNRRGHAFQDWIMEQDDRRAYPPVSGGRATRMAAGEAVFMGFDGTTALGRYSTVFYIDYEEE